jgi:chemosensory pili system protein ChpA (sensor histidine kinase/response regulator)
MSVVDDSPTRAAGLAHGEQDLGPLAWVLDELRKSLDVATRAVGRFVRDADAARVENLESLDTSALRIARQQLHQACGALDMVGLTAPALVLRGMEAAVNRFVQRPELCTSEAASTLERTHFALMEFLEAMLAGKSVSAVALFPQYRDIQALAGNDKVHPADLWPAERRAREPQWGAAQPEPLEYGPAARAMLDGVVLRMVKSDDREAAAQMRDLCLRFAAGQPQDVAARSFWKIAAGFFDAQAQGMLAADLYVKRMASRVLMQYAAMAKGDSVPPARLLQDLMFFCAQARPRERAGDALKAVHSAYAMETMPLVDYQVARFGRYDPAVLVQARKRIAAAAETWSALAGGDKSKIRPMVEQFGQVAESLVKLQPGSHGLARALIRVAEVVDRIGQPPPPELAIEVATAVLYLQASFATPDRDDEELAFQSASLLQRLELALQGSAARPLEPWMEELYRQASDHQTMGSVVGELRATMAEAEKNLDQYFRNPQDAGVLASVPGQMLQMRGVLSVLGFEQAATAMQRMRDTVEHLILGEIAEDGRARVFEKLGNSLGAMGFLIDMLSYQRNMARKLFVYDDAEDELRFVMGRRQRGDKEALTADVAVEAAPAQAGAEAKVLPAVAQAQPPLAPAALPGEPVPLAEIPPSAVPPEVVDLVEPASGPALDLPPLELAVPQSAPEEPKPAPVAEAVELSADELDGDDELLAIFLEEAREVVATGLQALGVLAEEPGNLSEQTTLRRAFHTLKGSSRMVGLDEFGEAGWAMEQMLNAWLAEQKPMPEPMQALSVDALKAFGAWAQDLEARQAQAWSATPFRAAADAMRLNGEKAVVALVPRRSRTEPVEPAEPAMVPVAQAEPSQPALAPELSVDELLAQTEPLLPAQAGIEPGALAASEPLPVPDENTVWPFEWQEQTARDVTASQAIPVEPEPVPELDFSAFEAAMRDSELAAFEAQELLPAGAAEAAEVAPAEPESLPEAEAAVDDGFRLIDGLRISTPLYNVYLNEADEWSARLDAQLQQWRQDPQQSVPEDAIALAHSLAGSSGTVGFAALSDLARQLEHALQRLQPQGFALAEHVQQCLDASDEIRRLLHQFAAGFLKTPQPSVLEALGAILALDIVPAEQPETAPATLEDGDSGWTALQAVAQPVDDPLDIPLDFSAVAEPAAAVLSAEVVQELERQRRIDEALAAAPDAGEEDIDVLDQVDIDLFPIFEEEAIDLLPKLGAALRRWHARPSLDEARNEALRALHTLKGSARLAGAMRMGEMAHRLESAVERVDAERPTAEGIEPLLGSFDAMQAGFDKLRLAGEQMPETPLTHLDGGAMAQQPLRAGLDPAPSSVREAMQDTPSAQVQVAVDDELDASVLAAAPTARAASQQTVRVRAPLLDRLISQAGEVLIARSRVEARLVQARNSLSDLTGNLERLRAQLRDVEVQAESQMQSRLALSKDTAAGFDPLEFDRFTRVQELTRMMAESVNDVATVQRNLQRDLTAAEDDLVAQGRQARDLQRDLLRTRMVEFDSLAERLYAVVRQTSKETGKQVRLNILGGTIEMDRGMLERMMPAFEHLLRNCVVHGIESPERRQAAGKPAVGTIEIILSQERNDVALSVEDDGAGLDLERIRSKAVGLKLWQEGQAMAMEDAGRLIFEPGFSTAAEVTGVAGRGIGMDVVRSEVNALGGRIETHSEAGRGSAFRLVLPLTTAVTQVVMLRVGRMSVGVPASLVEIVRRTPLDALEQAYRTHEFQDGDEVMPFYWGGALWRSSLRSEEAVGRTRSVVVVRSASQRMALHVDEVLGNQEVVIKNLGPQLSRLPGLTGMSVLPSGAVVQIYNPVALANVYGEQVRAMVAEAAQAQPSPGGLLAGGCDQGQVSVPLVLVVDDSITVRRVTQRLLQREGYRVALAADGLQALERLQDERPTVVLSDLEMPRMDGFDLLRNIRGDGGLKGLPVIMITSRIAQKHREMARELGADHYLGKPYSDEELLGLIQHYALQRSGSVSERSVADAEQAAAP